MFLLICKLYICIQNVFGHIFYSCRLHLYWKFWQFEVQKLAYMLILAAGGSSPYLSSVPPTSNSLTRLPTTFFVHKLQKPNTTQVLDVTGTDNASYVYQPPMLTC